MNIITLHECFIICYFSNLGCLHSFWLCCINFPIVNTFGFNCFKYFLLEDIFISWFLYQVPSVLLTCDPVCPVVFSEVGSPGKWKGGFQKPWPATKAILTSGSISFYWFSFLYRSLLIQGSSHLLVLLMYLGINFVKLQRKFHSTHLA